MKLRRIDTPHGRAYAYGNGPDAILMPSVTTVLSSEPSQYLSDLEQKIGKKELSKISERAAFRGTAMHRFLENYFICRHHGGNEEKCLMYTQKKTPLDLRNDGIEEDRIAYGRNLFYNYMHEGTFDQIKRVLFTEKFLFSLKNKFAGTTDFGFEHTDGGIVIADFKSASGHRGVDVVNKYKKQLGAYTIAYEEIYNREIKNAQVWISSPEGMQIEVIYGLDLETAKKEFLDLARRFHESWDVKPIRNYYIKNYLN
jgi:hypothetical protein